MTMFALLADAPPSDVSAAARDASTVAIPLLMSRHRILLSTSPSIAMPILLAAEVGRSTVVVEGGERAQPPIVLVLTAAGDGPETALFERVADAARDETFAGSLLDRFEGIGLVDASLAREQATLERALYRERPAVVIATGSASSLERQLAMAEAFAQQNDVRLITAGRLSEQISDQSSPRSVWRDLRQVVEHEPLRWSPLESDAGEKSEAYRVAWELGRRQAELSILAERLARRMPFGGGR